jgi:uncharacterized glyoxalase superfamily protein PhnB
MRNRSVPTSTIVAHVVYQDVGAALAWLVRAFGFVEHYRYGDPAAPSGAQLRSGDAVIMLRAARPGCGSPAQLGHYTQSLTLFVENPEAHCERARAAGAEIVESLNETPYGEHQYGVLDLEGHHWLFARHARNVSPTDWGAILATPA